jgi:hypothetical protein
MCCEKIDAKGSLVTYKEAIFNALSKSARQRLTRKTRREYFTLKARNDAWLEKVRG